MSSVEPTMRRYADVAHLVPLPCDPDEVGEDLCRDGHCVTCGESRTIGIDYFDEDGAHISYGCPECGGPCCEEVVLPMDVATQVFGAATIAALQKEPEPCPACNAGVTRSRA